MVNPVNKILGKEKSCPICGGKLQYNKFENKQYCSKCGNAYNRVELEELRM